MSTPNLGVALTKCFFCNEDDAIILNTKLTSFFANKVKEAHGKVISMDPCNKCRDFMKMGVIAITIDDSKSDPGWNRPDGTDHWMPNPYRAGGWFVVKDDFVKRLPEPFSSHALKHRFMFMEHEAAKQIGLLDAKPTMEETE